MMCIENNKQFEGKPFSEYADKMSFYMTFTEKKMRGTINYAPFARREDCKGIILRRAYHNGHFVYFYTRIHAFTNINTGE